MLFLTNPAPPRVTPPEIFRSHGNTTDAPSQLSDVFAFALMKTNSEPWTGFVSHLGAHMYATANERMETTTDTGFYSITLNIPIATHISPRVGFSFDRKVTEDMDNQLSRLGFSKETTARSTIYTGLVTPENATAIGKLQPNMDAYVPYGTTTLRGYMAFVMTTNILDLAYRTIPYPYGTASGGVNLQGGIIRLGYDTEGKTFHHPEAAYANTKKVKKDADRLCNGFSLASSYTFNGLEYIAAPTLIKNRTFSFSDPTTIIGSGIFLPYFHGMNVEDKGFAAQTLTRRFLSVLGKNQSEALQNADCLKQGFKTLSMTNVGKELSHQVACLDLALNCGAKPHAYILQDGSYLGCVLLGEAFTITKNGKQYEPLSNEELRKELALFNSHDTAIIEICSILNGLKYDDKKPVSIAPHQMTGPRAIHNVLRKLTIPTDIQKELRVQLNRLSFKVTYMQSHKLGDLLTALNAIHTHDHLADSFPAVTTSPMMFSNNFIESTLMAFGQLAPSFIDKTGKVIPIIDTDGKLLFEQKRENRLVLPRGIPVYMKPLQDAIADWKAMTRSPFVQVKVTAQGHYANTSKSFLKEEGRLLGKRLSDVFAATSGMKKRTIKDVEDTEESKSKRKKPATAREFNNFFGVAEEVGVTADHEELEDSEMEV